MFVVLFLKRKFSISKTKQVKVQQRPHPYHVIEWKVKHKATVGIMRIVPACKAQHPECDLYRIQQQQPAQQTITQPVFLLTSYKKYDGK